MENFKKRSLSKKLSQLIGPALLIFIFKDADFSRIQSTLKTVSVSDIALLLSLCIPVDLLSITRWHYLFGKIHIKRSLFADTKVFYSSFLMGIVTPGRVGEFYAAFRIGKEGYSKIKTALAIVFLRLFDLFFVFSVCALAVAALPREGILAGSYISFTAYAGLVFMAVFFIFMSFFSKRSLASVIYSMTSKIKSLKAERDSIESELSHIKPGNIFLILLITLTFWTVYFYQMYFIAQTLGIDLPFKDMYLVLGIVTLAAAVPVTFIGLGTREFALVGCLGLYGTSRESALTLSLMLYITLLIHVLFSLVFWILEHRD
jgi:uncharacterized protein (TIRG00374 family)